MTWVEGAERLRRTGCTTCRTASSSTVDGRPSVGVRVGDFVLDLAAVEERGLLDTGGTMRSETLNAFMALGRSRLGRRARPHRRGADRRVLPGRRRAHADPDRRRDDAAAVRGRGLRRLLLVRAPREQRRPDLPARPAAADAELEAPADRLSRPGRHGRRLRHAGRPPVRPAQGPDDAAPTFGPSIRLDIEAEVGFVVGIPTELGDRVSRRRPSATTSSAWCCSTTGPLATSRPGNTCRSARSSASRSRRRSRPGSCRSPRWTPPRSTAPMQDPAVFDYLRESDRSGLDIDMTVSWNGTVVSRPPFSHAVLDAGAATRAHDRQRCVAAYRRSVRLRHGFRPRSRPRPGRFWS